jgi:hypothetical protein
MMVVEHRLVKGQDKFRIVKRLRLRSIRAMNDSPSGDDGTDTHYYLPATPSLSGEPGLAERFLTRLFRRRGALRAVVRPEE